ncbi:hypothetical protein L7F22_011847 [Adiantum nelumboides]|nr:hypothetical protein [Adiantum nelumboides]
MVLSEQVSSTGQRQSQRRIAPKKHSQSLLSSRALIYMVLLSFQYGAQPLLSKRFSGKDVIVSSAVISCEWAKVSFALIFMAWDGTLWSLGKEWTFSGALIASGLPAAMYALQNSLLQLGYRHLDSLTFSMLNQSKLLFTALFMFLILRIRQSSHQVGALAVLLGASLLLCVGESSSSSRSSNAHAEAMLSGVLPTLIASVLSGLASTLCQWAAQVKRRSSYLMTIEMSAIGTFCLLISMLWSPDGQAVRQHGFFYGWTLYTIIPVITNAIGGILVGLVTTAAGGVRKLEETL